MIHLHHSEHLAHERIHRFRHEADQRRLLRAAGLPIPFRHRLGHKLIRWGQRLDGRRPEPGPALPRPAASASLADPPRPIQTLRRAA